MDSPLSPPSSPVTATGEAPGWITATSNVLLFFLVFGLASSVDVKLLRHRELQLVRGCAVALAMQFFVLPFLGFCSVRAFNLEETIGVMLQIVVSSPGGAYSNWWCSMFNADLALSVTATALSTVLSAGLLPLNLYIYLSATYGGAILATLRWDLLLISISVVTTAVLLGLTVASKYVEKAGHESMKSVRRRRVTILGNVSGACLIIFSIVFSNADEPIWNKTPPFYYGIASPCIAAALLSHLAASLPCLRLSRPERMAITVECIYQNVGIGLSIAFSIFPMELGQSSKAAAVPLFYGFCQLVIIPLYVIICWRLGWSYAPSTDPIWDVLRDSYQHRAHYVDRPDPRTSIRGLTLEESSEPSPREAAESAI